MPLYNFFRFHAHMSVYAANMRERNLNTSISPGWAVAALLAAELLGAIGLVLSLVAEPGLLLVIDIASIALIAWLLTHVQGNINLLWRNLYQNVTSAPLGVGELAFALLGILSWAAIVLEIVAPQA